MSFNDCAKTEISELEKEKEKLIEKISEHERENQSLHKRLEILERKNARLSEVNDWLDQRCIRFEGDFAECVRVGADLEVKVQQLKKQLQENSDE